jgi:hypothetical protein
LVCLSEQAGRKYYSNRRSANIVACGLLKKEGHQVKFGSIRKIGIPFTVAAVLAAYLFICLSGGVYKL